MRRLIWLALLVGAWGSGAAGAPPGRDGASARRQARPGPRKAKRARTAPVPAAVDGRQARVESVTADAAFVNRGAADGLAVGQRLDFTRGGRKAGACTVQALAAHWARCGGAGLRVGDVFAVARAAARRPATPQALPGEAELARRAALLEGAAWALQDFSGAASARAGVGPRAQVLLSHTTFANTASPSGPFQQQRLDLLLADVELYRGLRASADVTVLNFSRRPAATRSAYGQTPVLLVHQLELGFRRADVPFSAALGRTWLRAAPGLLVIDGGQAAWRLGDDGEVGAWGGLLPDAARLTIAPSQWSAGAFGRARLVRGATWAQLSGRAGYAVRDGLGARAEVALAASLWAGPRFDAHAAVELGFGDAQGLGGVDAARLDLGARPIDALRLTGAVRYRGLPTTGLTEVGALSPGQRALHADLGVGWDATPGLQLGLVGGVASDFDAGLLQARVGPELSAPRLLGGPVGMAVGYLEEFGWLRARHGWLQVAVTPSSAFRVVGRGSWFQQEGTAGSEGLAGQEAGASLALEVRPWAFLSGRLHVSGRVPLDGRGALLGALGAQLGGTF